MSLANFLDQVGNVEKTFSVQTIYIQQEPNELDDGARIGDTIAYIGNATYPVNAVSVISSKTSFQPAFQTGFSSADYLRVRLDRTTNNFTQLLNLDYFVDVNANSKSRFDLRFALYDPSLNLLQAYDPVTYDPSNIASQPALLTGIELKGWSIEIPNEAEYGFLEISGTGVTSLGFQYANSQVFNAIDNSDPSGGPAPSRPSKNIFYADWGAAVTDASDIIIDLATLTAEVAQLEIDVSQADLDISDLSGRLVALDAEKLDASGGVVLGSLIRSNTLGNLPSGWGQPFAKSQSDGAYLVYEGGDISASWNPAIGVYGSSTFPPGVGTREVYVWAGSKSGNQRTAAWETATMTIDDNLTMGGLIQMAGNRITDLAAPINPNDATTKTYVDTCGSNLQTQINQRLPLSGGTMGGVIAMGSNKITGLGAPTTGTDAATKGYVDSQTTGFLPLTGGSMSGPINMTGQGITALPAPSSAGDAANKQYVDTHASGNYLPLAGGSMTGAISMGNNGITNTATPVNPGDVATKSYADQKLALTGGALTGVLSSNSNITTTANISATGNVTCATLNYTSLNPPFPATLGINDVLIAGSNAGGQNITNVGNIQVSTLSSAGSNIQINQNDFLWPLGGIFIGQDAGANTTALCSFYQYNKATDYTFTPGATNLQYALVNGLSLPTYEYILKRGFTSLYVNRAPNTGSPADNFLTLPDPDSTWAGTKIELLISSTSNANNYLSIATFSDTDGLMLVRPWMNWYNESTSNQQTLTYPSYFVASGGELDWVNGTGGSTPLGGLIGLSWWNQLNPYNGGSPTDTAKLNAISGATQMYTIECKSAQKAGGFGYRWVVTPVYSSAQISSAP